MNQVKNVLFLCPHAAAKSVPALTYFADLASQAGFEISVSNAGTEPDPTVNSAVADWLLTEGFDLTDFIPPLLTSEDLKSADMIVSLGCISVDEAPATADFRDWSDVPLPSAGLQASRDKIYQHVVALVSELSA